MIQPRRAQGGLLGVAVGDALSVRAANGSQSGPSQDPMEGGLPFGHPNCPPDVWSDSTSLTFCTVEALLGDYTLARLGELFAEWLQDGYWASGSEGHDPNEATREAIMQIAQGVPPGSSGTSALEDGDSGPLMRILPIALAFSRWSIPVMIEKVHEASRVTHAHARHLMASGLYALIVRNLAYNRSTSAAYRNAMENARKIYEREPWRSERRPFRRIMRGTIGEVPGSDIDPDGSVVHGLEASVWCLSTTRSFRDCLLRAVGFGCNGSALVAIAGGLAGVAYGVEAIPDEWINSLVRKDDLIRVSERFAAVVTA